MIDTPLAFISYNSSHMNLNKIGSVKGKNVLFLQGPMGYFFSKLEKRFKEEGAQTYKIGFNFADYFFSLDSSYTPYRDTPDAWPDFIKLYLLDQKIEMIFLFGDCRYYQVMTAEAAQVLSIELFVFEEGYIRPDYITLERSGVNNYSMLSQDPDFYHNITLHDLPEPQKTYASQTQMVVSVSAYYLLANLFSWRYPHYRHHRNFSAIREFGYGLRSIIRKYYYVFRERQEIEKITTIYAKKYFFVPLQTHNDFQILQHSGYGSIEKFIIEVLESFYYHSESSQMLVFKHHPVDRGRKNYTDFIARQMEVLGLKASRVKVYHDVHLPTLLKNARGTITINSTVGLSSLYHNTPTVVMGKAIYNMKGLAKSRECLDLFWHNEDKVDEVLYQKFRQYLVEHTQINGSFYGELYLNEDEYK